MVRVAKLLTLRKTKVLVKPDCFYRLIEKLTSGSLSTANNKDHNKEPAVYFRAVARLHNKTSEARARGFWGHAPLPPENFEI